MLPPTSKKQEFTGSLAVSNDLMLELAATFEGISKQSASG
jgi:hypothetical protein